jgi:hypothetical protein
VADYGTRAAWPGFTGRERALDPPDERASADEARVTFHDEAAVTGEDPNERM